MDSESIRLRSRVPLLTVERPGRPACAEDLDAGRGAVRRRGVGRADPVARSSACSSESARSSARSRRTSARSCATGARDRAHPRAAREPRRTSNERAARRSRPRPRRSAGSRASAATRPRSSSSSPTCRRLDRRGKKGAGATCSELRHSADRPGGRGRGLKPRLRVRHTDDARSQRSESTRGGVARRRPPLLDRDGLREVARLVDVRAAQARDPVREQLQRHRREHGLRGPPASSARRSRRPRGAGCPRCPRSRPRSRARRGPGTPGCSTRSCRRRCSVGGHDDDRRVPPRAARSVRASSRRPEYASVGM